MLETLIQQLLLAIGENPQRSGLKDTPQRVAESWRFLTQGYQQTLDTVIENSLFPANNEQMIIVKNIEFYSLCEHHLLPFFGKCHIGYLPNKKIIGLGKIPKIVNLYARRLQIQENLTEQIVNTLLEVTQAQGVGIVLEAQHLCMLMHGQQTQQTVLTTSKLLGCFKEQSHREEFYSNLLLPNNLSELRNQASE